MHQLRSILGSGVEIGNWVLLLDFFNADEETGCLNRLEWDQNIIINITLRVDPLCAYWKYHFDRLKLRYAG
jgi:hypothetical protein